MIGEELLRYKKDQKYLTWDTETCNLLLLRGFGDKKKEDGSWESRAFNRPWQNGFLRHSGKTLLDTQEHWIKWEDPFEVGVQAAIITHFTWEEYNRRAKPAKPLLEEFEKYLYDPEYINVFANGAGFDCHVHAIFRQLVGLEPDYSYLKRSICVQILHKAITLQCTPPKIGTDAWVSFLFKMQSYHTRQLKCSLKHLCEVYEVPYIAERHHVEASYDTLITKEVLDKQLFLIEI